MFYSAKMYVTIDSETKDPLPEWVSLTPPISMHRRGGEKNNYFY
jgi:hypothetical protein